MFRLRKLKFFSCLFSCFLKGKVNEKKKLQAANYNM